MISINRKALKAASRFSAKNDIRYYLNGVFVEANETETRLVATDGSIMIVHRMASENSHCWTGILPIDVVNQILKVKLASKRMEYPVELHGIKDGEGRIDFAGQAFLFKPIDGTFPDYCRVIPKTLSGEPAIYKPEYLQTIWDATKDLGTQYVTYGYNGETGPGLFTLSSDCFAIVMPYRGNIDHTQSAEWARERVKMPVKLQAVA